jgi:hypothetical protein
MPGINGAGQLTTLWLGLLVMLALVVYRLIARARAGRTVSLSAETKRLSAGPGRSVWQLELVNPGPRPLVGATLELAARAGAVIAGHGALLHPGGRSEIAAARGPGWLNLAGVALQPGEMLTVTLTFDQARAPGVDWRLKSAAGPVAVSRPDAPAGAAEGALSAALTLVGVGLMLGPVFGRLAAALGAGERLGGAVRLAAIAGFIAAACLRVWPVLRQALRPREQQ